MPCIDCCQLRAVHPTQLPISSPEILMIFIVGLVYQLASATSLLFKNGGASRNRTGVNGVAVRCMTTLPSRQTFCLIF